MLTEPDDADFKFRQSPSYIINLLSRMVTVDYLRRIKESGIAPAQAYVLGELWREEPLSQVELSRRLDIGKATVGQTLLRLEKAGLVRRIRPADDRRLQMIELTPAGRKLKRPLYAAAQAQLEMMEDVMGPDDLARLTNLLERLAERLRDKTTLQD